MRLVAGSVLAVDIELDEMCARVGEVSPQAGKAAMLAGISEKRADSGKGQQEREALLHLWEKEQDL